MEHARLDARGAGDGIVGIKKDLARFTYKILNSSDFTSPPDDEDTGWDDWVSAHSNIFSVGLGPSARHSTLSLAQLEWIGSLLWHTLRYDLPVFPRDQDLAFHLSLCAYDVYSGKRERFNAVWAAKTKEDNRKCTVSILRSTLQSIKRTAEAHGSQAKDEGFYEAVAKCLCHRPRKNTGIEGAPSLLPIAITGSFDAELELILDAWGVKYHVLFPVIDDKERHDWLLIHKSVGNEQQPRWHFVEDNIQPTDIESVIGKEPLIVKTRGAPLEDLPNLGETVGRILHGDSCSTSVDIRLNHRIDASDYEFTRSMITGMQIPGWVKLYYLDQGNRLLVYLGYPLDDADGVFSFHKDVNFRSDTSRSENAQMLMDYPYNAFRHGELGKMKVSIDPRRLAQFAEKIHEKLEF